MIAHAPLRHRSAEVFGKENSIGGDLELVGLPSVVASGAALLVFYGDELTVAVAGEIHLAANAPSVASEFQTPPLTIPVRLGFVQGVPSVNAVVGDADLLDFLQIEQPLAVGQRVQCHHADERIAASGGWGSGNIVRGNVRHRGARGIQQPSGGSRGSSSGSRISKLSRVGRFVS